MEVGWVVMEAELDLLEITKGFTTSTFTPTADVDVTMVADVLIPVLVPGPLEGALATKRVNKRHLKLL